MSYNDATIMKGDLNGLQVDKLIQEMFAMKSNVKWRNCDDDTRFQWYYAEDNHYLILDTITSAMWFVKAKSPASAYEHVKGKLSNGNG